MSPGTRSINGWPDTLSMSENPSQYPAGSVGLTEFVLKKTGAALSVSSAGPVLMFGCHVF
jgi:hypothetical protein